MSVGCVLNEAASRVEVASSEGVTVVVLWLMVSIETITTGAVVVRREVEFNDDYVKIALAIAKS
jgi:hypothetical protein